MLEKGKNLHFKFDVAHSWCGCGVTEAIEYATTALVSQCPTGLLCHDGVPGRAVPRRIAPLDYTWAVKLPSTSPITTSVKVYGGCAPFCGSYGTYTASRSVATLQSSYLCLL